MNIRDIKISSIKGSLNDFSWEYKRYMPGGAMYGQSFPLHAWAEQIFQNLEQIDLDEFMRDAEMNVSTNSNVR